MLTSVVSHIGTSPSGFPHSNTCPAVAGFPTVVITLHTCIWNLCNIFRNENKFLDLDPIMCKTLIDCCLSQKTPFKKFHENSLNNFQKSSARPLLWKTWKCQGTDSRQGNVRDFTKNQGNVREKILSGKSSVKLFIVSCIFASTQAFSTITGMIWVILNMLSAVEKCHKPSENIC